MDKAKLIRYQAIQLYADYNERVEAEVRHSSGNLYSSEVEGTDKHAILLDLDVRHDYIESSTAGHAHLYVDVTISQRDLFNFMHAAAKVGLLDPAYVNLARHRGYAALAVDPKAKAKGASVWAGEEGERFARSLDSDFLTP